MKSGRPINWANENLAQNAGWMFLGRGLSVLCQSTYFLLLTRLLGSTEYGIYVGAVALVAILSQYTALGSHSVLLRYVSANPKLFPEYWGNVLVTTLCLGGTVTLLIAWGAALVSRSYAPTFLLFIAIGDCLFAQVTIAAGRVFQAFERMHATAALNLLTNAVRMMFAAGLLLRFHRTSARYWVFVTMTVSAIAAITAVAAVSRSYGRPRFIPRLLRLRTGEGLVFAFSYSTTGIYNDIDKVMLGYFGMNMANGVYTMAYRLVDVCTMPLYAIQSAAFPRFFKKGAAAGVQSTKAFAASIAIRTAPLCAVVAVAMFWLAPIIPHLAGKSFAGSVSALRWLCLLPLFRSFHVSAGDALSGAGQQKFRLSTQAVAAAFNFVINLFLIPRFGWTGAAWSSLATDGLLAILNWTLLLTLSKNSEIVTSLLTNRAA